MTKKSPVITNFCCCGFTNLFLRLIDQQLTSHAVFGWLQRVQNTFLRCLGDASKSVCCFALQDMKSCGYPKTCDLFIYKLPIAKKLEHPTGIWKVIGSIPTGGSDFFRAFLSCTHYLFVILLVTRYCRLSIMRTVAHSLKAVRNKGS